MLDTNKATNSDNIIINDNDFKSFITKQLLADNLTYITSYLQEHSNKDYISINIYNHHLHLGNAGKDKKLRHEFDIEDLSKNSLQTQASTLVEWYVDALSLHDILSQLLSALPDFMSKNKQTIVNYATYKYMTNDSANGLITIDYMSILQDNINLYILNILNNFKTIYLPIINSDSKHSISRIFDIINLRSVDNNYPILVNILLVTINNKLLMQPKFANADISSMIYVYLNDDFYHSVQVELPIRQIAQLFSKSTKLVYKPDCFSKIKLSFNSTSDIIWLIKIIVDHPQDEYVEKILTLQKLGICFNNTDQYTSYVQEWLNFFDQGEKIPPIIVKLKKVLLNIFVNCC